MKKFQKPLLIAALVLDVGITVFLFVISILILAKIIPAATIQDAIAHSDGLVKYLLEHPTVYLIVFVIPLFVLLAGNVAGLLIYVKKTSSKQPAQLQDLSEEQKEALRQELLKDLAGPAKEEPKEEPAPEEEAKEE